MTPLSTYQKVLAAGIFAVIVFFGFFHITESPPFTFDEGWAFQISANIARSGMDGAQFSPGTITHVPIVAVGYPLLYPLAAWFKLFGIGLFQARTMMLVYMLGLAIVSFLLARRLYGNGVAIVALAILATFPPFYSFGKSIFGEVPVLFFLVLSLLCFNLATNSIQRKTFWLIMAGIAAGLCIATKPMALVLMPVLVVGAYIYCRRGAASWKDIGIVAASTLLPIFVWIAVNFHVGDSFSSMLDFYANPAALTDRSATFWLNLRFLFTTVGGLYALGLMAAWTVGIVVRIKQTIKISAEECMAFMFAAIVLCSFMFHYADARYLFPVQALGMIFAPYSIYRIFAKRTKVLAYCAAIVCTAGLYQLCFDSYVAGFYSSTQTKELSGYFSSLPPSTKVFFYNSPNAVALFSGRDYYQRIAIFEKWVIGSEFAPIVNAGAADVLVISSQMTKLDEKVPLDKYVQTAEFGKTIVYKKK